MRMSIRILRLKLEMEPCLEQDILSSDKFQLGQVSLPHKHLSYYVQILNIHIFKIVSCKGFLNRKKDIDKTLFVVQT